MFPRRSSTLKYFLAAFIGAILYCEWFVYEIQPKYWHDLNCLSDDPSCTKILFIADPQIQGDKAVPPPLSYLFNWDSDRYLKMTFKAVIKKYKPDILVYLGDLMDEGSISTMPQFHGYVKRLSKIFSVDYPVTQVWIPGDNDIGGENEIIHTDKVLEFDKVFFQPAVVAHKNISFYKVNVITHTYPHDTDANKNKMLRVVVSHYPVTFRQVFGTLVNKEINPNVYFSAHEHNSKYIIMEKDLSNQKTHRLNYSGVLKVDFNENKLHEIMVPTCSYRMGTSDIGYGAAIIDNNNRYMRYTVFWSSTRFPYLLFYLGVLLLLVLYMFLYCTQKIMNACTTIKKSVDKVPLLDRV